MQGIREFLETVLREIELYQADGRSDSAAFLAWFLVNFFRLDAQDAIDAICDSPNDKGIDGLVADEIGAEISLFQSKYATSAQRRQGDADIRDFVGTSQWFDSPEAVEQLLDSTASEELKSLISRFDVVEKVGSAYAVKLYFVTSKRLDPVALEYMETVNTPETVLEVWDLDKLRSQYARFSRATKVMRRHKFSCNPRNVVKYSTVEDLDVIVLPLKASEIADMEGIQDRSLFARNVRYGLGRTRVNREIQETLRRQEEHDKFFLYHNGLTIVCDHFSFENGNLIVENYSIVNGCQSVVTFFENRNDLTKELAVLAKVIGVDVEDPLAEAITYSNNNQNSISMRDLRSNHRIQIELQNEFEKLFGDQVQYRIKRGEEISSDIVIDNEYAAQMITAFYLGEPYSSHQKYKLFDASYYRVFHRRIRAEHIYLAHLLMQATEDSIAEVQDDLIKKYGLTKFLFLHVMRRIMEKSDLGSEILDNPRQIVLEHSGALERAAKEILDLLVVDFNYYVGERQAEGYFDYKSDLKSEAAVTRITSELLKSYDKGLVRHPEESFELILQGEMAEPPASPE